MTNDTPAAIGDWVIEKKRNRYSPLYLLFLLVGLFVAMPTPPEITYTLRHRVSGERRRITLPGDHTPAELSAMVAALQPRQPPPDP